MRRWLVVTRSGEVVKLDGGRDLEGCAVSPRGTRAILYGTRVDHRLILSSSGLQARSIFESGHRALVRSPLVLAMRCHPQWSCDETRLAYGTSRFEDGRVGESFYLEIHNLLDRSLRSIASHAVQCVQWVPDDRAVMTVESSPRGVSVLTYPLDGITTVKFWTPPLDASAGGFSIAPDGSAIAYHADTSDEGGPKDHAFIHNATAREGTPVGPIEPFTQPRWSPLSSRLAFLMNDRGAVSLTVFDRSVQESKVIAVVNRGDATREAPPPSPVWLPDGRSLVFSSFEREGSLIALADLDSGTVETLVRADARVLSLSLLLATAQ